uniref:Pulmonary surfactant-associated protein D-like n=1 Tax=Ciona intestinalis TaxID=7719 RepID=F6Q1K9_CIOIN|nr:pulmonary surfactant-associated protein D-like [Ciona intestinalis]|eukprot:XP_002119516.1 pulmonary surfactant-associated protein D-like [Ciona intestinalis]
MLFKLVFALLLVFCAEAQDTQQILLTLSSVGNSEKGAQGPPGPQGRRGPPGLKGLTGPIGGLGPKGQKGECTSNSAYVDNAIQEMENRFGRLKNQMKTLFQTGVKQINGTAWFSAGNGYLYRTLPASNYQAANRSCAAIGATLAVFAPRNMNITRMILHHFGITSQRTWIGMNDIEQENTWVWENGERVLSSHAHWNPGEPNSHEGEEDCGMIFSTGKWNDGGCHWLYIPLCEMSVFDA